MVCSILFVLHRPCSKLEALSFAKSRQTSSTSFSVGQAPEIVCSHASSCHMWGPPEDLVLFGKEPANNHSMQLVSHSEKTPHTPCTFEDSNYCHLLEYMPIAMVPVFLGDRCDHIDSKLSKVVCSTTI